MRYAVSCFLGSSGDYKTPKHDVEAASVLEAVRAFLALEPSIPSDQWYGIDVQAADAVGPELRRAVMNYERDPMAEVSDGYLSNMAAYWTEVKEELAHKPKYCTAMLLLVACAHCGAEYAANEYDGNYGRYTRCPECRKTMGRYTKRFSKMVRGVAHVCGAQKEARLNGMGMAYAGCPKCNPEGDYERKPIRELVGGR